MNKKPYIAPAVVKVQLKVMNAILANCHSSPTIMDPKEGPVQCSASIACYIGPNDQ